MTPIDPKTDRQLRRSLLAGNLFGAVYLTLGYPTATYHGAPIVFLFKAALLLSLPATLYAFFSEKYGTTPFTPRDRVIWLRNFVLAGFAIAVVYQQMLGSYYHLSYPYTTFLSDHFAAFNGFHELLRKSSALNPYKPGQGLQIAYPPFAFICARLIFYLGIRLLPFIPDCLFALPLMTELLKPIGLFMLLVACALIYAHWHYIARLAKGENTLFTLLIFTGFTYPLLFAVDRANLDLLVLACFVPFLLLFARKCYWAAGVFLAITIALKFYTIVYLPLLLIQRRYREFAFTLAATAALYGGSFALLRGGLFPNIHNLLRVALLQYSGAIRQGEAFHFTSDLFSGGIAVLAPIRQTATAPAIATVVYSMLACAVLSYLLWFCGARRRADWQAFSMLTLGLLLLPPATGDARSIFLFVPIWLYLQSEPSPHDLQYLLGFGLLLAPKNYLILSGDLNIGMILNPLLLLGLLIRHVLDERVWHTPHRERDSSPSSLTPPTPDVSMTAGTNREL